MIKPINYMKNSILYFEKENLRIIGNVNFLLPDLAEVQMISPYQGFILQGVPNQSGEPNENKFVKTLLERAYDLCKIIQSQKDEIGSNFRLLLETLEKFNNKKVEDYHRNSEELMKIFMKNHFSTFTDSFNGNTSEEIFRFLSHYFIKNGKCADLDIRTRFTENAQPPIFSELDADLKEYLEKNEYQRIELLAEQILTRTKGKYDWFLQQEFLDITN